MCIRDRTIGDAHALARTTVGRVLLFEVPDFLAEDVPARIQYPLEGRAQRVGMQLLNGLEIKKRKVAHLRLSASRRSCR